MEITLRNLSWYWFKGNETSSRLLQDVCLFRSHVLYDGGTRSNFGDNGKNFGDIQYADFESVHIVACLGDEILGVVRITPPRVETVAQGVLGRNRYRELLEKVETDENHVIEINRLMIDRRIRKLNLGRTLMYAAVALIHRLWDRGSMTIIGSAGNCTKQAAFFLNYTDYVRIENMENVFAGTFNDDITFLRYRQPPYTKGVEWIEFFKDYWATATKAPFASFRMGYREISVRENELETVAEQVGAGLDIAP